jgi:hypothetical protein
VKKIIIILGVAATLIPALAFAATELSVTNSTDHKITISDGKGQYVWVDPATSYATDLEATIEPAPGTQVEWIIVTDTGRKCTAAQGDKNSWDISATGGTHRTGRTFASCSACSRKVASGRAGAVGAA